MSNENKDNIVDVPIFDELQVQDDISLITQMFDDCQDGDIDGTLTFDVCPSDKGLNVYPNSMHGEL